MKVAALIDGFNLYHSMDNQRYRKYKWLNFSKLFRKYVNSKDKLEIHYFTTINYEDVIDFKINKERSEGKLKRHLELIRAEESKGVFVHYGYFKDTNFECEKCGHRTRIRKEKQTDVGIGAYLAYLAFSRNIDKFIILSADTDLISAIKLVKQNAEEKIINLLLPPDVFHSEISKECNQTFSIKEEDLKDSLFPVFFENKEKEMIVCPKEWNYVS